MFYFRESHVRRVKEKSTMNISKPIRSLSLLIQRPPQLWLLSTGGLAGTAALGEGATVLSYLGHLGVSGGSTYIAVEGGKDFIGAAIESSGSDISYWCALTQKNAK